MATQAEATNYYYFLRLGRNSGVQFKYTTTTNTVRGRDFPQPHDTLSRRQAIFALIVTLLLNFLQLKYQGKNESPFETHPKTTLLALVSLVLYLMSCDAKVRISENHPYIHCLVNSGMTFFGPLSLACLSSILFPESLSPILFPLSILFSIYQLPQSLIKESWEWLKATTMDRLYHHQPQQHGRRGLVSVQLPWIPQQLAIRDELDIHDNDILPV